MSHPADKPSPPRDLSVAHRIDVLCDEFEQEWLRQREPSLEHFLDRIDADGKPGLLRELLRLEADYRRRDSSTLDVTQYVQRFPDFPSIVEEVLCPAGSGRTIDLMPTAGADQPVVLPVELAQTLASSHPGEATSTGTSASGSAETDLMVGRSLGPYRLLELLGQGGMGAVYKARHEHLDKTVAIKVLPQHITSNPDSIARFKREMKAVGRIDHPNIVRAMDAGEVGGTHYLAMEYVAGTDLTQLVKNSGPLPVDKACDAIRQAALALEAAHEIGLIHRDIKPANLLLTKSGQIKLLDLGLALLGDDVGTNTELTTAGQTFGTPDYMAPEQWENAHAADARTDLYALGCTLFYLLVGHAPYAAEKHRTAMAKMKAHALDAIPDFSETRSDIPEKVQAIYKRLLAKSPDERFQSAAQLAEALAPFSAKSAPVARVVSSIPVAQPVLAPNPATESTPGKASGEHQPSGSPTVAVTNSIPAPSNLRDESRTIVGHSQKSPTGKEISPTEFAIDTSRGAIATPKKPATRKLLPKTYLYVAGAAALILCGVFIVAAMNGTWTKSKAPATSKIGNKPKSGSPSQGVVPGVRTDNDSERAVAEWVINNGGAVALVGQSVAIAKVADLPRQRFVVEHVNIRNVARFSVADAQRLTRLRELNAIRFHATTLDEGVIRTFAHCRRLQSLFVSYGSTSDTTLTEVLHIPQLRSLQYDRVAVSDDLVARLGQLDQLQFVQLYGSKQMTEQALIRLGVCPRLICSRIGRFGIIGNLWHGGFIVLAD